MPSFVKGPASFLQVTRTTIRAWMALDFCQSQHMTTELAARVRLKKQCFHVFSVAIELILFKLADKENIHNILYVCIRISARLEDRQQI